MFLTRCQKLWYCWDWGRTGPVLKTSAIIRADRTIPSVHLWSGTTGERESDRWAEDQRDSLSRVVRYGYDDCWGATLRRPRRGGFSRQCSFYPALTGPFRDDDRGRTARLRLSQPGLNWSRQPSDGTEKARLSLLSSHPCHSLIRADNRPSHLLSQPQNTHQEATER